MVPYAILGAALCSFLGLFAVYVFWVPRYLAVFQALNAKLPHMTVLVIELSQTLQAYWFIAVPAGLVCIVGTAMAFGDQERGPSVVASGIAFCLCSAACAVAYVGVELPLYELRRVLGTGSPGTP